MIGFNAITFHSRNILYWLGEENIKKQKTSFFYLSKAVVRTIAHDQTRYSLPDFV